MRKRLMMLPIPKVLKIRNNTTADDIINPLLVFVRIREKVNSKVRNKTKRNIGTIAKVFGSRK